MFVVTKGPGLAMAMPDVCKQPVGPAMVPTPFPNIGNLTLTIASAQNVKILGLAVIVKPDMLPMSQGDELGSGGGAKSAQNMAAVGFNDGSKLLYVCGCPAVLHLSPTAQNGAGNANAVGQVMTPTQTLVDAAR